MRKRKRKSIFLLMFPLFYNIWNEAIFSFFLKQGCSFHKISFAVLSGLLLYWCGQWTKKRSTSFLIQTAIAFVYTVIYCSQIAYYTLFETPFYLKSLSGAGDTMTDFFSIAVDAVVNAGLPMCLMLLYFIAWIVLYRKVFLSAKYSEARCWRAAVAFTVWLCAAMSLAILDYNGAISPSYMMLYEFVPTQSVKEFGMLPTAFLDLKYNFLHLETQRQETVHLDMDGIPIESTNKTSPENTEDPSSENHVISEETVSETESSDGSDSSVVSSDPLSIYDQYNVMDIDFSKEEGKDEELRNEDFADMNQYFSSLEPSKKNSYTGMFQGKNLILITAEGFSKFVIDPELTPTLYKLYSEGFQFNHFYTPIWGVSTSDGEFVATTGLIPKAGVWSYTEIADNYMPFAFGNQFKKEGYLTDAFHNHTYTYYNRDKSYPNMGYTFYAKGHGLNVSDTWPESDVEMIQDSFPLYTTSDQPFHIYYMSVSGHMEYTWKDNYISYKNRDRVSSLQGSEAVLSYLACQLELEDALTELLALLEEEGVLEDTVIALSADHYPYGLTLEQYRELRGEDFDEIFGLYENAFLLWSPSMDEPISVDTYCSSLDIAPTLANLFGLEYDSRLYIGTDIFGDKSPVVCFQDRSFITNRLMYDNSNKKIIQLDDREISEEYLSECIAKVKNMFYYSSKIIENDYYGYLFDNITDPEVSQKLK